jgi:hypothetical protein
MAEDSHRPEQVIHPPNGCRWCGIEDREHFQRWKPPVGWHQWVEPTPEQRKERILARRRRKTGSGTSRLRLAG